MIRQGYDIELQECQENSFSYLASKGISPSKKWITKSFEDLPSGNYDVIIINMVVYAFDKKTYMNFIKNAHRILKSGGVFLIIDPLADIKGRVYSILRPIKRKFWGGKPTVFWGYVRNFKLHNKLASTQQFSLINNFGVDASGKEVELPKNILGYAISNKTAQCQCLVYKKI